jgi:hypothetical protein
LAAEIVAVMMIEWPDVRALIGSGAVRQPAEIV